MKRKVHLIHTGGTFGMESSRKHALGGEENSLLPSESLLQNLQTKVPEISEIADISCKTISNLDSSDIGLAIWSEIASHIENEYQNHDGFVIIHGTDTLCYTASALSYFLKNLQKPIVITGSQRPLSELRNDARTNLIDSVELACKPISKVMVCFDSIVYSAQNVTKFSSERMDAFRTVNALPIAQFGVEFNFVDTKQIRQNTNTIFKTDKRCNGNILSLNCLPSSTLNDSFIELAANHFDGMIVRGFGTGNLPSIEKSWVNLCKSFTSKNKPFVVCSQCTIGGVHLNSYANGRQLVSLGALSANNMSFENASVRLMVFLGRKLPFGGWEDELI
jgi:L-asparaginase